MTTFIFRNIKLAKGVSLIRKSLIVFFFIISISDSSAQKFIIKYNLYETFYKNYFLYSEIFLNEHNTISLGIGYLYQPNISNIAFGKFSCKGVNGLLEYRHYIDFIDQDNAGHVSKIRGFFIGGYGRIFNFRYSYDSLNIANKYISKNSDDRDLYSFGIEAGYHAIYKRISFELFLGYCLLWQYDYKEQFRHNTPFYQPEDNISSWAKHHIGVGIGYVFRERSKRKPQKKPPEKPPEK